MRTSVFILLVASVGMTSAVAAQNSDGPRVVRGVDFEGNKSIDQFTLASSISTTQSSWWRWLGFGQRRLFNQTEFRRDVLRLMLLYRQFGFPRAQVDTVVRRSGESIYVKFQIREGRPTRVQRLSVSGVDQVDPKLAEDLPLREGEPFNRFLLRATSDTLRRRLRDRGYPFALVFRNFDVNLDSLAAWVDLDVLPGTRARVGSILVDGNQSIEEDVIRNWLATSTGDWFSQRDLIRSQRDLYRTNLFDFVDVKLVDSLPTRSDSLVRVRVRVTEGRFYRIRAGLGYGTADCFRTLGTWSGNNVLGGGRQLEVQLRLSKIGTGENAPFGAGLEENVCRGLLADQNTERLDLNFNLTSTLTEPFFLSRWTSASFSVTGERRSEYQAFLTERVGTKLSVTQRNRFDIPVTLSYDLSYGQTSAEPAVFCTFFDVCRIDDIDIFSQARVQSFFSLGIVRDRTNSPVSPSAGTILTTEVRLASDVIGSDELFQFLKGVAEFTSYHPVGRRSVFAWRVRAGLTLAPEVTEERIRFVSPDERFYLGGPSSVRGFNQNEIGPVVRVIRTEQVVQDGDTNQVVIDTLVSPTGGDRVVLANAEYRFPLPVFAERLSVAVFVDAGQVFSRESDPDDDTSLRITPGAGIRIATPLGPVRLDVAYNPYDPTSGPLFRSTLTDLEPVQENFEPDPPKGFLNRLRLHFSVGQAF